MRDLVSWWWCANCIENAAFYNVYFNFRVWTAGLGRLLIRLHGWIAQTRNSEGESSPSRLRSHRSSTGASCLPQDFQVPSPSRFDGSLWYVPAMETRRNERSLGVPSEIKFRPTGSASAFYLLPVEAAGSSSTFSGIKGSFSLVTEQAVRGL